MNTKVSIILPARNEEEIINKTLTDIFSYLRNKKYKYEVLTILNGCSDKTEEIINSFQLKYKSLKIYKSKAGYGLALKEGLKRSVGEYVVIFNVDFYDLKMLDLIDIDLYGKDFVIGSKMAHWSTDKRPIARRVVSLLFNTYLKILYGFKGSDTHGIKIIKRSVIDSVLSKCKTTGGIMDTEFVLRAQKSNFKFADFPVYLEEVRLPRFINRFIDTPRDIFNLFKALK
jgi:glycosyltransferase involved in cell wall biosynthesis